MTEPSTKEISMYHGPELKLWYLVYILGITSLSGAHLQPQTPNPTQNAKLTITGEKKGSRRVDLKTSQMLPPPLPHKFSLKLHPHAIIHTTALIPIQPQLPLPLRQTQKPLFLIISITITLTLPLLLDFSVLLPA